MTVKEKIFELNKQFQISYYDKDFGFFSHTAPDMITQIKDFLTSVINEQHRLRPSISKYIEVLNQQLEDLDKIAKNTSANEWVKDKWLIGVKEKVINVCYSFRQECWNFDENILNQIV